MKQRKVCCCFFFASPITKNIVAPFVLLRFLVKLICCTTFGLGSSFCCLLKPIANNL